MTNRILIALHRWSGILAAALVILCGLTGSVLVFRDDVDRQLNADMLVVTPRGDHLGVDELIARVEARFPSGEVTSVAPHQERGRAWTFRLGRRTAFEQEGPQAANRFSPNVVYVDPYTGAVTGTRTRGEVRFDRRGFVPLVHGIHHDLLLGRAGHWIVAGIGALWMLLSLAGIYLAIKQAGGLWAAFRVRTGINVKRLFLDLHRSFGMASVVAVVLICVSGIYLNLRPEVSALVSLISPVTLAPERTLPANPVRNPAIGFGAAMKAAEAAAPGGRVHSIFAVRPKGVYRVRLASEEDVNDRGDRFAYVSMEDARVVRLRDLAGGTAGDTFIGWQFPLHTGEAFGLSGRLIVFFVGLLPLLFSVTGIYLWLVNRRAQRRAAHRPSSARKVQAATT
jgi:uncharacterized iron-regulated membrane protein